MNRSCPLSKSPGAAGHPVGADHRAGVRVRRTAGGRSSTREIPDQPSVRLIRLWANGLVSPPEQLIHAAKMGFRGALAELPGSAAAFGSRTSSCSRPSTASAWSRPRCWRTPGKASGCKRWSAFRRSTSTRRWRRRPSAPAAAMSSRVFYIDKGADAKLTARYGGHHRGRHRGQGARGVTRIQRRCWPSTTRPAARA